MSGNIFDCPRQRSKRLIGIFPAISLPWASPAHPHLGRNTSARSPQGEIPHESNRTATTATTERKILKKKLIPSHQRCLNQFPSIISYASITINQSDRSGFDDSVDSLSDPAAARELSVGNLNYLSSFPLIRAFAIAIIDNILDRTHWQAMRINAIYCRPNRPDTSIIQSFTFYPAPWIEQFSLMPLWFRN